MTVLFALRASALALALLSPFTALAETTQSAGATPQSQKGSPSPRAAHNYGPLIGGENWGGVLRIGLSTLPDGRRVTMRDVVYDTLAPPDLPTAQTGQAAAQAHFARARNFFALAKEDEYETALLSTLAAEPDHLDALIDTARWMLKRNPWRVVYYAERALKVGAGARTPDVLATIGAAHIRLGDRDGAERALRRLAQNAPAHPAIATLQEAIAALGAPPIAGRPAALSVKAALAQLDVLLAQGGDDPQLLMTRSELRWRTGDAKGAKSDLDILLSGPKPVAFRPNFAASLRAKRAMIALALGDERGAAEDVRWGAVNGELAQRLRVQLALRSSLNSDAPLDGKDSPAFRAALEACLGKPDCLKATVTFLKPNR
jgi:hypothetical protein